MNDIHYEIHNFPSLSSKDFLEKIHRLNQENTPEVGSLTSIDHLEKLIKYSSNQFYVKQQSEIIGFIICFREKSLYDSPNYKFFSEKESQFLYIDRIAIKEKFRRQGIGKRFYTHIEKIAHMEKIPLCCEVNTFPENLISIKFHIDFGFSKVGDKKYKDHSVAFFKK